MHPGYILLVLFDDDVPIPPPDPGPEPEPGTYWPKLDFTDPRNSMYSVGGF